MEDLGKRQLVLDALAERNSAVRNLLDDGEDTALLNIVIGIYLDAATLYDSDKELRALGAMDTARLHPELRAVFEQGREVLFEDRETGITGIHAKLTEALTDPAASALMLSCACPGEDAKRLRADLVAAVCEVCEIDVNDLRTGEALAEPTFFDGPAPS